MSSRRQSLEEIEPRVTTNAGLWMNKYMRSSGDEDKQSKHDLVEAVAGFVVSDIYKSFFKRWRLTLEQMGLKPREAVATGRMVLGTGDESVLETSVTLHRTYGVPYIPGSALKGLAASYARLYLEGDGWRENGEHYLAIFGDTENAGFITFFDALYVPQDANDDRPLAIDVLTVHHQHYYQSDQPPADWDDPVPVPFLSATGKYLLALTGPDAWVNLTLAILKLALAESGVGAKTSSGYGRLRLLQEKTRKPPAVTAAPAAPQKPVETQEEVVLETEVTNRTAQVKLASGESIRCGSFPGYQPPIKGERCRAIVVRVEGKPVGARFLP